MLTLSPWWGNWEFSQGKNPASQMGVIISIKVLAKKKIQQNLVESRSSWASAVPVGGGATGGGWYSFTAGAPGPPWGYPDPGGAKGPDAIGGPGWFWKLPGYTGSGAPVWELGDIRLEGKDVGGMKLVGGTPGLGMGGSPPDVDDGGCKGGPDKLAAGTEGPVRGKAAGLPVVGGWCWNGWWGWKPGREKMMMDQFKYRGGGGNQGEIPVK